MGDVISVAIVGRDDDAASVLYLGLKSFPADKVVLIATPEHEPACKAMEKELQRFHTPVDLRRINSYSFEEIFRALAEIREVYAGKRIIVNVDTDYRASCIALSASFVNGVQAIGVVDDAVIAYPVMKFSYYNALSDRKLLLAKIVAERGRTDSLEELSRKSGMSLPLVVYHVRGSKSKPGLEQLGLVETHREKGRLAVEITPLGKLIIAGYVSTPDPRDKKAKATA